MPETLDTFLKMHIQSSSGPLNVDKMFRALSDRTRLRIVNLLRDGERCVCDLVEVLGVPQPAVSRHLAYLRDAGFVVGRKEGLWHHYRLVPARRAFHRTLLACVESCGSEVPELVEDAKQMRKIARRSCCD